MPCRASQASALQKRNCIDSVRGNYNTSSHRLPGSHAVLVLAGHLPLFWAWKFEKNLYVLLAPVTYGGSLLGFPSKRHDATHSNPQQFLSILNSILNSMFSIVTAKCTKRKWVRVHTYQKPRHRYNGGSTVQPSPVAKRRLRARKLKRRCSRAAAATPQDFFW